MRLYFYKTLHNLSARLGMDKLQFWCYRHWMRCHMENDALMGYFNFADDYFNNGYKKD